MENNGSPMSWLETGPTVGNGGLTRDTAALENPIIMSDVYWDGGEERGPAIAVWFTRDTAASLILDDAPEVEGGTFNVILENRKGVPFLIVWTEADFGLDPTWSINLVTGERDET